MWILWIVSIEAERAQCLLIYSKLSILLCWNELQSHCTIFQNYAMHKYANSLPSVSPAFGSPQIIWKYNALYHFISHFSDDSLFLFQESD